MRRMPAAMSLALVVAACGSHPHPPTSPSSTAPGTTSTSGGPVAAITVKVDAAGSRDAIASLSPVIVDASTSTGTGLTYAIDFGDGTTATTAAAQHTYATPATFTITATVTDSQGRKATTTAALVVQDATGNWFQAGFAERSKRIEVRRITIDAQTGTSVRGVYRVTGEVDKFFTGTLTAPRSIRLVTDGGGVWLEGTLPGKLHDAAELWTVLDHGDGADGKTLGFHAIVGMPDTSPPAASFKVSAEGGLERPFPALTPVHFDGSASRGSGLSSFIEFGDGTSTIGPQATRVVDANGSARFTVVDAFGRSDAAEVPYFVLDLTYQGDGSGLEQYWQEISAGVTFWIIFYTRSGVNYVGGMSQGCTLPSPSCPSFKSTVTASMSGARDIRVTAPGLGVTFQGTVDHDGTIFTLVQSGGSQDGRTWRMRRSTIF